MNKRQNWFYLRIVATAASFTLFGLGGIILGYLVFPLVSLFSASPEMATLRCRRLIQLSFRGFVGFMTNTGVLTWSVEGREKLAQPGQLIVANHPSLIDIVFLISMLPNATCIVKPDLFRNIFTRGPVTRAGYIANDAPEQLVEDCVTALRSDASLVVFPEGTRSEKGQPGRFRRGAAYVLLAAQCPLILATIAPSPTMLTKHEKWHEIPYRRPHFKLNLKAPIHGNHTAGSNKNTITARELTKQWRNYFIDEVTT